ncbi:cytochrome P450 [Chitinophaga varians]|uniref:cytochrome P450 n=1 Tax=Chitinophaga varians TaxID=2202339 RepID=UPI00165EF878|nr:cytochrome P450 [Chitinophaga varians]MBC9909089.1 cytochrome P450 [Chitinophaga varians]
MLSLYPDQWIDEKLNQGVYFDPTFTTYFGHRGSWHVYSYEDVKKVLTSHEVFSNKYTPRTENNPLSDNLNQLDPPEHARLRAFMGKTFTPSLVKAMEPAIYTTATKLVNKFDDYETDFVSAFAASMPADIISQLLGIRSTNFSQVAKWVNQIASVPSPDMIAAYFQCQEEIFDFLMGEVKLKRDSQELISQWQRTEISGELLTEKEIVLFCMNLYLGGSGTLSGLLEMAIFTLAEKPEVQKQLSKQPGLIPEFIEELLRFRTTVPTMYRMVKEDTMIDGQHMKKGDIVTAWICTANKDSTVFDLPHLFDIQRKNASLHLSLGHGVHFCAGSYLLRTETRIALEVILQNLDNIQLVKTPVLNDSLLASSFDQLLIRYSKRP